MKSDKSIRQVIEGCGLPRLEARMLMEHVLKKDRGWIIAHDDENMLDDHATTFDWLAAKRLAGQPMAYLIGQREFLGRVFEVSPSVLIPRPETELLVESGLECLQDTESASVLDLGTGSGIIAITIAAVRPAWQLMATDLSQEALDVARRNATRHQVKVEFFLGCWYQAIPRQTRFDLILSNPPYIREGDQHLDRGDLRFEPRWALTDGADGLTAIREIVQGSLAHLHESGQLWVEHGYDQAEQVRSIFNQYGFRDIESKKDLSGIIRITGGRLLS